MANLAHFTDDTFDDEVLKASTPVVVDFFADWCQPCKMLAPIIEELAAEYGDKVKVGKLDVSENPATAAQYSVMSIPTVIVFKDGEAVETHMGFMPKAALKAKIDAAIG